MLIPNVTYLDGEVDGLDLAREGDLTVLSLNINRLQNKLSLLENFLDSFSNSGRSVDIIFLSETFLKDSNTRFYNIEGYNSFHSTREGRDGGGIVFFLKKSIKTHHKIDIVFCREVQFLIINLLDYNVKICVYRPPSSFYSLESDFLEKLDGILDRNNNLIVIGDVNIDLLKRDSDDLKNIITCNGFHILNSINSRDYTRHSKNSSIIDHVYTDIPGNFTMQLGESGLSDHKFILLVFKVNKAIDSILNYTKKVTNYAKVAEIIEKKEGNFKTFEEFHSFLKTSITQQTKLLKKTRKTSYRKPWATEDLKKLCKEKRKYANLKQKFPSNVYFKAKFVELRRKTLIEVTAAKKKFYSQEYHKNMNNPKSLWKIT